MSAWDVWPVDVIVVRAVALALFGLIAGGVLPPGGWSGKDTAPDWKTYMCIKVGIPEVCGVSLYFQAWVPGIETGQLWVCT